MDEPCVRILLSLTVIISSSEKCCIAIIAVIIFVVLAMGSTVWAFFSKITAPDVASIKTALFASIFMPPSPSAASENEASHAFVHRALIAARLKDSDNVTGALVDLVNRGIFYDSLMTNHHYNRSSAYCTDFAIGYLGVVHESLVYSNTGKVELLPAVPQSGFDVGQLTGIRVRTQAVIDNMTWNLDNGTVSATITSDINQTITVSNGLSGESKTVTLSAGEPVTVNF